MGAYKKGQEQVIVPAENGEKCFYPNCRIDSKLQDKDACVTWRTNVPLETIYSRFPPVVKLAIQENSYDYEREYKKMAFDFYLHPECAAEWGMQLIKDALNSDDRIGRRLSNREKEWGRYDQK